MIIGIDRLYMHFSYFISSFQFIFNFYQILCGQQISKLNERGQKILVLKLLFPFSDVNST